MSNQYTFKIIMVGNTVTCDIIADNLSFCDGGHLAGVQGAFSGEHPNYQKLFDLCVKASDVVKEIHALNVPDTSKTGD